jgi:hypothetical protein
MGLILGTNTPDHGEVEEIDTASEIEESFIAGLSGSLKTQLEESRDDPEGFAADRGNRKPKLVQTQAGQSASKNVTAESFVAVANTEKLLTSLYGVRDGLVSSFSKVPISSSLANDLTGHINILGACINELGGRTESFAALDHVSGLAAPNLNKNASKVLDTTKACYTLGEISNDKISDSGRMILISFSGEENGMKFLAEGEISVGRSTWSGNEAIDYVYTPGAGKMSVKAFEGDSWVDKSEEFSVNWNLFEGDIEKALAERDAKRDAARVQAATEMAIGSDPEPEPVAAPAPEPTIAPEPAQTVVKEAIKVPEVTPEPVKSAVLEDDDDPDLADFPVEGTPPSA